MKTMNETYDVHTFFNLLARYHSNTSIYNMGGKRITSNETSTVIQSLMVGAISFSTISDDYFYWL